MDNTWKSKISVATGAFRMLPGFVIPGEAKCGTTSLYGYLCRHPWIVGADMKEPESFIRYGASPLFCRAHYPLLWNRWLSGLTGKRLLTGEASADYFSHCSAPEAVAHTLPRAKIVILLRDPVKRAFSDYQMFRSTGREPCEFDAGVEQCLRWARDPQVEPLVRLARCADEGFLRYIFRGVYVENVRRWKKLYPPEQLLFLRSETLFREPQAVLDRVFAFLGVPPHSLESFDVLKKGKYQGLLSEPTRSALAAFYRPYNEELYGLIGEDFGWAKE